MTERFASCAYGKLRSVAQENYARFDVRLSWLPAADRELVQHCRLFRAQRSDSC